MAGSYSLGNLLCFGVATVLLVGLSDARYIRSAGHHHHHHQDANIPEFLLKMYEEMGQERFQQTWQAFNRRASEQQDAFLMEDLSEVELSQLAHDFENLAVALSEDFRLMELYGEFERNLNIGSFVEMDKELSHHGRWWSRIKRFLFRKLEKLAQEMKSIP